VQLKVTDPTSFGPIFSSRREVGLPNCNTLYKARGDIKKMANIRKLLMLVPYAIEAMNNAPMVRAYNMYNALKEQMPTILVHGGKYERMLAEAKEIFRKQDIGYVYIEAMASDLTLFDRILLDQLRRRGALLFPFIRDLYWRFRGTLKAKESKVRLAALKKTAREKLHLYHERELKYYLESATALLFPDLLVADTIDFPHKYALPPAGDASRCLNPEIPQNRNVTFVGGISSKEAEIDILMEAMAIVVKKRADAHCTIVGYGDEEIVDRWKDKDYVTFLTNKTYKDIPRILSDTYATVIPSPRSTYNDFAMPLKLFDYMSCGRPIIATNCTAMAGFIEGNEIGITTDDNPESFAQGILELLDNRDLARKYGTNALSAVKDKHSWKHRAEELMIIMHNY